MDKNYVSSILEIIKRNLDANNSQKHFSLLSHEFYELFNNHYNLVKNVDVLEKSFTRSGLATELDNLRSSLEGNLRYIIEILGQLTNRKFVIYVTTEGDTLWKLAKRFNSNIDEICELNNIKSVFRLEEEKVLLIPVIEK
jgi:hypothetical protein